MLQREKPELDGLELMTNNMDAECRRLAAGVQRQHNLAGLGSSDAHDEGTLGVCYTKFPDGTETLTDLVSAIRGRRITAPSETAPADRSGGFIMTVPPLLDVRPEPAEALCTGRPVVASNPL